jgi:hypothetical protein
MRLIAEPISETPDASERELHPLVGGLNAQM